MGTSNLPLQFKFYGVSPWELEVIYSLLHNHFKVEEYPEAEKEDEYTTMIDILFPLTFNDAFFKWFGSSRWDKVKEIIKEMKRRRGGGKSFMVHVRFSGRPGIIFTVDLEERRLFDTAIDKIDFVLELLPYHLDPQKMPKEITHISYYFDEINSRWNIDSGVAGNDKYLFLKNEWRIT